VTPLTFRHGPHPAQVCDLHLPDGGPGSAAGVAVLLHGGYWRARYDRSLQEPVARDLADLGWAVWNVDYRGVDGARGRPGTASGTASGTATGTATGTFADVAAALDLLPRVAADLRLPLHRVVAVGHSAGGTLALWSAARHRLPDDAPGARPVLRPGAVVAQAAVCDLVSGAREGLGDGAVRDLMGGTPADLPRAYGWASPTALLPLGVPIALVTGDADDTVPAAQSLRFAHAARAAGDDVTLVVLPGEGHYGHLDPFSPVWQVTRDLLEGLPDRSPGS